MSQMVLTATLAALLGLTGARRLGLLIIPLASLAVAVFAGLLADGGLFEKIVAAAATLVSFQVAALAGLHFETNRTDRVPSGVPARVRRP
jgi:peptidoglycan/LPS O-acetylase OafA/YrhL